MDCTIHVAKTKALISFAVTAKLICVFVFAYAKSRFSHDQARIISSLYIGNFKPIATIMILRFWTDRSGQTAEEQSDQGLHCLLFHLHLLYKIP